VAQSTVRETFNIIQLQVNLYSHSQALASFSTLAVYKAGEVLVHISTSDVRIERKITCSTKITCALCTAHEKFNAMYNSMEYLPRQSQYRISCPLVAKRTNTLWTTFMVNVRWLFPFFSQPQHIDLECCATLSHTPVLLQQLPPISLYIYMVALNATISSELLHARSLTRGQIPELFE